MKALRFACTIRKFKVVGTGRGCYRVGIMVKSIGRVVTRSYGPAFPIAREVGGSKVRVTETI